MIKNIVFRLLFASLKIRAIRKKPMPSHWDGILIPLSKPIGIGDLVMLSPIIKAVAALYPKSQVVILSELPDFIDFPPNVYFQKDFKRPKGNWLCLSLLMNLKHYSALNQVSHWLGYFVRTKAVSNFVSTDIHYDGQGAHFVERGLSLLKILSPKRGEQLALAFRQKELSYPIIRTKSVVYNEKKKTLALGLFSQFDHSLWSLNQAATVLRKLYEEERYEQFLVLGDSSERNLSLAEKLIALCDLPEGVLVNFCGKTKLSQAAYCIQQSHAFLGVDSGLAHLAYALSPKVFALYIITRPENIIPQNAAFLSKITAIHAYEEGEAQLFDGLNPVDPQEAKAKSKQISSEQVLQAMRR